MHLPGTGGQRWRDQHQIARMARLNLCCWRRQHRAAGIGTVSLDTNKSALSARSFLRATLALQRAKDSKGVSLSVNYWF